jgi:hypothetical protein
MVLQLGKVRSNTCALTILGDCIGMKPVQYRKASNMPGLCMVSAQCTQKSSKCPDLIEALSAPLGYRRLLPGPSWRLLPSGIRRCGTSC